MSIRFISRAECADWCEERHLPMKTGKPNPVPHRLEFRIPQDAGARVSLCRSLWMETAGESGNERLIWITDWSVWPSGEHLPLWTRLREALGTSLSLMEAPGCICDSTNDDDGLSVLVISCLYLWDCWLLTDTGVAVFLSHDEIGSLFERSNERPTPTESELLRRGLVIRNR